MWVLKRAMASITSGSNRPPLCHALPPLRGRTRPSSPLALSYLSALTLFEELTGFPTQTDVRSKPINSTPRSSTTSHSQHQDNLELLATPPSSHGHHGSAWTCISPPSKAVRPEGLSA